MSYRLQDIIDVPHFQNLQDRLNTIYSFPSAIIDNDGNILTATAWQDVCTKFHRKHPECAKECIKSDQYILSHLHEANPAVSYRCPHGLTDNATPIIIEGIHYGNFFTGQFFMEPPDLEFFRLQARRYGFDETEYLAAVQKVPVWSRAQLESYLYFIKGLIAIISESGLKNLREMEARKRIEESEERAGRILEQMHDGFWTISAEDGRILDVNAAMCRMVGYSREEMLRMHVGDIVRGDSAETIAGRLREFMKGDSAGFESIFHRKDGNQVEVEVTISYLATRNLYYCFHRDITERKRAEADLRRSQKLESLGLLAGGIAHDFNNLLGGIYGYIDLAVETMAESEAKDELAKALKTIDRARGLTRQLLTFAKGGDPVLRVESLFPLVKETAQFALSGSNVSLSCQVADGLRPCRFDRNQIAQVVDNIVINAVQAMPGGGRLTITAANVDIEPGKHPLLEVGQYVCISFEDSGIGMPGDILPRVFDPFYTTKSTGHGLGLATCYSIIKRHGGIIEVESEPNKGSTFRVYLPTECHGESLDAEVPGEVRHRGTGTVLVVDDEVVVQETIAGMLRSFGYRVECVSDGAAAIATLEKQFAAGEISTAVILDLTVPGGMGGKEAAEEMGRRWPALPLFVASGYAEDPVMARPTAYGFVASIRKPFTRSELAAVLEQGLFRTANFWRSSI